MKYIVVVDGQVTCGGVVDDVTKLGPNENEKVIVVPDDTNLRDTIGRPYVLTGEPVEVFDETALGAKSQRIIPLREFLRRWTVDEKVAIEEASEAPTREGRRLRVGWREIVAGPDVNLDHPDLVGGLGDVAGLLVRVGVWKDEATATQRLSEIRDIRA